MRLRLTATEDQRNVITSPARMLGVFAGRRWGKTYCAMNRMVYRCCSKPVFKYWYIAPSYAQALEVFDSLANHPGLQRVFGRPSKLQPFPLIWFRNG